MKKISVIIPTYNEEKTIEKCLNSLGKQTYRDLEIVVVDDGSSDNTLGVISNLQFTIYNLQILKQSHKGPGEARNLGAKNAKGDILVFVDADMTFAPDFIEKLVTPIVGKRTEGTWSRDEYVSNWDNIWARCWNINEGWEDQKRHPKNYPKTQKVFRAILKSEFDKVGGFDRGGYYTDDWSLSKKLGYEAIVAPGALFYHENPDNLVEVFNQSKWSAKRKYKFGVLGWVLALIRVSLPLSIILGITKSAINWTPEFFVFKLVYDTGVFIGMLEYTLFGRGAK